MALHLQKLCVGADSIEDLESWIAQTLEERRRGGLAAEQIHTTRMTPKRVEDLLDGGSLYWVIRGVIQVRQRLMDLRPVRDAAGIARCQLVLEPVLVRVDARPRRAFQGWRYLETGEAPPDLGSVDRGDLPPELVRELIGLGLM